MTRRVQISRPEKVLFPDDGITKADLAAYYESVAPAMLPQVKNRPLMLQRFPNGIGKPGWIQQEIGAHFPDWVARATVKKDKGNVTHPLANNAPTLVYLADQACITLHGWLSRVDHINDPDLLIIDLDPGESHTFADVRKGARAARGLLDDVGLPAFLKTTGSKGLHIVVPLKRRDPFDEVRAFGRDLARALVKREPKLLTTEVRKNKRQGRIFVDMNRNAYAQLAVVAYSVRALKGAPVSAPIDWDELSSSRLNAQTFTLKNVQKRLERDGDPWKDMARRAVTLGRARGLLDKIVSRAS
jgi:bifunctional non-homologous end joining protein LigD